MMLPLISLVASASAAGASLVMCSAKNRSAPVRKASTKSSKSKRSTSKSTGASTMSSKSQRSSSKNRKSSKNQKSGSKSSAEKSGKSKRSSKSAKVVKPGDLSKKMKKECKPTRCDKKDKSGRQRSAACDSAKSAKVSKSGKERKSSKSTSGERILKQVPNDSQYAFPEGQIKPSSLRASPNKLPFAPSGGVQSVMIANSTKSRKAFKVKTSDNYLYRVNPVYGFVEPGAKMSIDVLRHNGEKKTDNLVVITSDVTGDQKCAKTVFESDPARELTVVPLVAH